jgi:hypothetical protein
MSSLSERLLATYEQSKKTPAQIRAEERRDKKIRDLVVAESLQGQWSSAKANRVHSDYLIKFGHRFFNFSRGKDGTAKRGTVKCGNRSYLVLEVRPSKLPILEAFKDTPEFQNFLDWWERYLENQDWFEGRVQSWAEAPPVALGLKKMFSVARGNLTSEKT